MPHVTKHRRSKRKQRIGRTHKMGAIIVPLMRLASGKVVPRHMVTEDNPTKKGVRFIRPRKK